MTQAIDLELVFPIRDAASAWLMSLKAERLRKAGAITDEQERAVLKKSARFLPIDKAA